MSENIKKEEKNSVDYIDNKKLRRVPLSDNKSRDWQRSSDGTVTCFTSTNKKCYVNGLQSAKVLSTFHDERLADATDKINSILEETKEGNQDKSKCLSILLTPKGLFLAWTVDGITSSDEDEDELCRQLGL